MVQAMAGYVDKLVVTQNSSPRALASEELFEIAQQVYDPENVFLEIDLPDALDQAVTLADEFEPNGTGGIVALGSVVTAADVRSMLAPLPPYPPAPEVVEEPDLIEEDGQSEFVDEDLSVDQIMERYLNDQARADEDPDDDERGLL